MQGHVTVLIGKTETVPPGAAPAHYTCVMSGRLADCDTDVIGNPVRPSSNQLKSLIGAPIAPEEIAS